MRNLIFNKYKLILTGILGLLIGLLFQETFHGMILQGVDDNISMRQVIVRSLLSKQGYHFISNYWIGFIFNVPNPDLYNFILEITGNVRIVGVYIIALFLSGYISYTLLRRLDITPLSSIFGSISYTFLPHVLSLVYSGHVLALEAIPMTPGFLLCLTIILDNKSNSLYTKLLAGAWGGIFWAWMMIGEPQRGLYGTVLGMAWVLYILIKTKSISFKQKPFITVMVLKEKISFLFGIVGVGLGIFLSTIKFWTDSEFLSTEGSWEFSTGWSFPPKELMDTFAFGYHGLSSSDPNFPYHGLKPISGNTDSLGFFLLIFMVFAIVFAWKNRKDYLKFFFFVGLITLLLSFGKYFPGTPLYWLWYQLPGMDKFRVPAKFLSMTGLSWSIVAAMGLDTVMEIFNNKQKNKQKLLLIIIGTISILSLLWLGILLLTEGGEATSIRQVLGRHSRELIDAALTSRVNAVISMSGYFIVLTLGLFTIYQKNKFIKFFPIMIILLTMYNLYTSNRYYIQKAYVNESEFYTQTELITFLKENLGEVYRASGSLYLPNTTSSPAPMGSVIEHGLYSENNYDLTYLFPYFDINMFGRIPVSRVNDEYKNFFKTAYNSIMNFQNYDDIWELNKRLWYIGNVKYIIIGEDFKKAFANNLSQDTIFVTNVVGTAKRLVSIYQLKNILPRFALLNYAKPVYDLYLFDEMTKALTNINIYQLPIEDIGLVFNNPTNIMEIPTVDRIRYNAYEVSLNNNEDKILYFGDLYDSGWHARIDGEKASIYKANGIQQYILIPEGSKKIVLEYKKPVKGLLYSRIFILLMIVLFIIYSIYNIRR